MKKIILEITLTFLLISLSTVGIGLALANVSKYTIRNPDEMHSSFETRPFYTFTSIDKSSDNEEFKSPFIEDHVKRLRDFAEWRKIAYHDDDSMELVVRLNNKKPNCQLKLVDLIKRNEGKPVNTVSLDGKIVAVVADIPYKTLSNFRSEVETAGLLKYIEPNIRFKADFSPNDPNWPEQWGSAMIEANHAWNVTLGDPSVLVAVIDTGVDWDHPDLAANYVPLGYDWVNNDTDPMDDHGHGTHCAGIIGAVINNSVGIAGLAQVRIMAEKGLDKYGSGSLDNLANAIIHAVDQGADIMSNSWGAFGESALLYEAVKYANDHGVLVIAAAGNDASECKQVPAHYEEVVAVTATNRGDNSASFTNFGDWIELAAPGVKICSTWWNDTYEFASGTSMSAPHVAGVAALVWSQFPNLTRDQLRAKLRYTTDDLGSYGFDEYFGYGRINARRAIEEPVPDHDLALLYWKMPSILKPFSTVIINCTLLNFGISNESGIEVNLMVNDSIIESMIIDHLASGESTTIGLTWNPTNEGKYNVTLHILPIQGEISTENNVLFKYAVVRLSEFIEVPLDFQTVQKAINAVYENYSIRIESGIYFEHIIIDKSITVYGESSKTTIIDGNGTEAVVWILGENVNITQLSVQNGAIGLFIYSNNSSISRITAAENMYGIAVYYSAHNTFRNNSMINNQINFYIDGYFLSHLIHDIDMSNNVDNKPIYYWINRYNMTIPLDAGYVALVNCTNITIKNLNLTRNGHGVLMVYTSNSTLAFNNITDVLSGIYLWNSHNCSTLMNHLNNCFDGIVLGESGNNTVECNMVHGLGANITQFGVILVNCGNNTILDNMVSEVHTGVCLAASDFNIIENNTVSNCGIGNRYDRCHNSTVVKNSITNNVVGIHIETSNKNDIYHNNMIGNKMHIHSSQSISNWDDGYPSGGNYWDNYAGEDLKKGPNQDQPGRDEIGDIPYLIDDDNQDQYPLWNALGMPSAMHDLIVFLKTPANILPSYSSILKATIVNKGLANETLVEFLLMIDGHTINSTVIPMLQTGASQVMCHEWTPMIAGMYNITAYTPPVASENFTTNNIVTHVVGVSAGTSIFVDPPIKTTPNGALFTVNVNIIAVENLHAWQANISFNNTVLNCTDAQLPLDHVFRDEPYWGVLKIDNEAGYVAIGAVLAGDIPAFNGSGTLCQIRFKALAEGISDLTFSEYGESTFLLDKNLQKITDVTLFDGVVEVGSPLIGDINVDGKVDILDIAIASSAFGSYPSHPRWNAQADINNDGKVDIMDIAIISSSFGRANT